jgi:lysosomal acid lipase/cholesteryl ester hydrolase
MSFLTQINQCFSWDQMAQYDLPSMINKVIDTTNEPQVFYIGHSMGTTTLMAMSDIHPEMKEKIILANLLAPVAFVEHMRSPIALIAPFANIIEVIQMALV